MKNRNYGPLLLIAAVLSGCVNFEDGKIDFSNGLKKDIRLASDGMRIPLGDLDKFTLDSLIDIDDDDPDAILKKLDDGIYGINVREDIDTVDIDIDEVSISIADPEFTPVTTDFENPTPGSITVDTVVSNTSYDIDIIDLDGLNECLPTISQKQVNERMMVSGIPDTLDIQLEIESLGIDTVIRIKTPEITDNGSFEDFDKRVTFNYHNHAVDTTLSIKGSDYVVSDRTISLTLPQKAIDCSFTYNGFPEQVEKISSIYFGSTPYDTETGQLIDLNVDLSRIDSIFLNPRYRVKELNVTFPEEFVLKANPAYKYADMTTVSGNTFTLKMREGTKLDVTFKPGTKRIDGNSPTQLPISFYLVNMNLNQGATEGTSTMEYIGEASFAMEFEIAGQPCLIGEKDLNMSMEIQKKLQITDLTASVREQDIELGNNNFSTTTNVSGLEDIRKINSISFNPDSSFIYVSISGLDISPFNLADNDINSNIHIRLPKIFQLESECRNTDDRIAGTLTDDGDSLLLTLRPELVIGDTIAISVNGLNTSDYEIEDGMLTTDVNIGYDGHMNINPVPVISLRDIKSLGTQNAEIKIWGSLCIRNADVVTSAITTGLSSNTSINVDESIDNCVLAIREVNFVNPASISAKIDFNGIPGTIENISMNGITISFPEFLSLDYSGQDKRIALNGHTLSISGQLEKDELTSGGTGFVLDGLTISGLCFNEPLRTVEKDGGKRIIINDSIKIDGEVTVDNQRINSDELSDITLSPVIHIDDMTVSGFRGIVFPSIDPVDETVELDLGDDLDFLSEDSNRLVLSHPELTINLVNNFDVPVLIDLSLSSRKTDGKWISRNICPDKGTFTLPGCPEDQAERTTTIIISNDDRSSVTATDTMYIQMSSLPDLMSSIPDEVIFNLSAHADTSLAEGVYHYADLNRKLYVAGSYEVNVPLTFDELYVEYTDTIDSLATDLEDIQDLISGSIDLEIGGNLESTIPLELTVNAKATDKDGKIITDGVLISECQVAPGRKDSPVTSKFRLNVTLTEEALKALDGFILTAVCTADHTDGGASLDSSGYLHPKDMYLILPDGIDIELDSDN